MDRDTQHPGSQWNELEKYRIVFRSSPDYVTFSNLRTGVFIDVNPGFERLIGYSRAEVVGQSSSSIGLWPYPEERQAIQKMLADVNEIQGVHIHFRSRDGVVRLFEASMSAFEADGDTLLVAVARDITERKRQEDELNHYKDELERLVEQRTMELRAALDKVQQLAIRDELTGAFNRRELHTQFDADKGLYERIDLEFCIAILDLDRFKSVNDTFGHAVGDLVLKQFAEILNQEVRVSDCIVRYGGDEFVLLLRGTTLQESVNLLNRISLSVRGFNWGRIAPDLAVTTSIGVAAFKKDETLSNTLERADVALYRSKLNGRNQVSANDS